MCLNEGREPSMGKNDTESTISETSIDFLEDVRKGKPRRFVMICKGQTVVTLVVYKKGGVDKAKKEAKAGGATDVSFGVVDGKGPNIVFKLSREDGFKEEPTSGSR